MLWRFTEEEEHALLAALERHWDGLLLACEEKEVLISRKEIYEQILKIPCVMAPAKDDIFVFDFIIEDEMAYLQESREGQELSDCGCGADEHANSLLEWYIRNLT